MVYWKVYGTGWQELYPSIGLKLGKGTVTRTSMREYFKDLLHFSTGVRWFVLTEAFLGIGIGIFNLLLNLHMLALGFDEAQIGAVASMGTVAMAAVSLPSGILASRFGRKNLLVLGLALMGAGYAAFAAGTQLWMMYGAQFLQSAGISFLITTEIQLLYSYSKSKKEETQGFSMLFAVFTLFMGLGTLAGGYMPDWLGGSHTSYQGTLYAAGAVILCGAAARYMLLPREQRGTTNETETSGREESVRGGRRRWGNLQLPNRAVWIFCGMNVLIGTAAAFVEPFLNVIVKFRLDWTDEATSLLLTVHGIALFVSSFLMPPLLERLGISATYRLVFIVNLFTTFGLAFTLPAGMFSMLLLIRGGAFIMVNNLILTHSMSALPEKDRNTYAGLRLVLRSIGASGATLAAGVLLAGKNYGLPFLAAGAFLVVGYVYFERWVKPLLLERLLSIEEA